MATTKRRVQQDGVFADPYESVRGTANDPAREHNPALINNSSGVGTAPQSAVTIASAPVLAQQPEPSAGRRGKRRKRTES